MKTRIRAVIFKIVDGYLFGFDANNNKTYYENGKGFWWKRKFDEDNLNMLYENSQGYWIKYKYNKIGKCIAYVDSYGLTEQKSL